MTRALNKLSAQAVKAADPGKHFDGGGLWFAKGKDGNAKWFLRVVVHGQRREMGLGPYPAVSLKEARLEAEKWRAVVRTGQDPIKLREKQRRDAERNMHLLQDVARDAFESRTRRPKVI